MVDKNFQKPSSRLTFQKPSNNPNSTLTDGSLASTVVVLNHDIPATGVVHFAKTEDHNAGVYGA